MSNQRGQVVTLYQPITIVTEECYKCGVIFGITNYFKTERVKDHVGFYCPNGHSQAYTHESEADQNARLLREEQERHRRTIARANEAEEQKLARKLKRVKRGVCPECNRTFENLARHMKCKHETAA